MSGSSVRAVKLTVSSCASMKLSRVCTRRVCIRRCQRCTLWVSPQVKLTWAGNGRSTILLLVLPRARRGVRRIQGSRYTASSPSSDFGRSSRGWASVLGSRGRHLGAAWRRASSWRWFPCLPAQGFARGRRKSAPLPMPRPPIVPASTPWRPSWWCHSPTARPRGRCYMPGGVTRARSNRLAGRTGPFSVQRRVRVTGVAVLDADDGAFGTEGLVAIGRQVFLRIFRVQPARYRRPDRPYRTTSPPQPRLALRPLITSGMPGMVPPMTHHRAVPSAPGTRMSAR